MRLRQAMKAPPARGSWALLASLLLASCASEAPAAAPGGSATASSPQQASSEVQRLLAAATAAHETELDVSWGATFGAAAGIKQFEELFNRMYGLSVKINYTPGPSMTDMAGKVTQEVNAGQHSSTDVLLGTESHYAALVDRNVMEEYDYTKLSSRITPEIVAPRNIGVEVGGIVGGIAYNTSLVKAADVPRKLEDVLEPKWKGKIASNPDAALFDRVSARSEWGTDKMMDFVTKLSANVGGLVRCDDNQSVFSGQYLMTVLNCGSYQVRRDQAKGAPIAHTIPPDTATVGFFHLGVPRTASHPNLAKLFINMMLSESGQHQMYALEYTDHYALPGSQSVKEIDELRAKGGEPLQVNAAFILAHPALKDVGRQFAEVLRKGRT